MSYGERPPAADIDLAKLLDLGFMPVVPISPAELRLHIERIVESGEFRDSPRHRQLLRYLADHAIASGGQSIPPWSIQADVLSRSSGGRGRSLTPPAVMVDDVRRKLDRYATGAGRGDAIWISIPPDDCRLETIRNPESGVATPRPEADRSGVVVVEFDAEPLVQHLSRPLADAITEHVRQAAVSVARVSRPEIAHRGLAVEHTVAAWHARRGVHGMLVALPDGRPDYTSIGASVRLIAPDGSVVWTLWCEEPLTSDSAATLQAMAARVAAFVMDGLEPDGPPRER